MNKFFKIIVFFFIVFILFYTLNFQLFLESLKKLNWNYLICTLIFSCLYIFTEAILFKNIILNDKVDLSINKSFSLTCNTYLFNMILPLSGMAWRAYYLDKNYDFKYKKYIKFLIQFLILEVSFSFFLLLLIFQIHIFKNIDFYFVFGNLIFFFIMIYLLNMIYVKYFKTKNFITLSFITFVLILTYFFVVQSIFLSLGKNLLFESIFLSLTLGISNYITITPGTYGILEGTAVLSTLFIDILKEEGLLMALLIRLSIIFVVLINYIFNLEKSNL